MKNNGRSERKIMQLLAQHRKTKPGKVTEIPLTSKEQPVTKKSQWWSNLKIIKATNGASKKQMINRSVSPKRFQRSEISTDFISDIVNIKQQKDNKKFQLDLGAKKRKPMKTIETNDMKIDEFSSMQSSPSRPGVHTAEWLEQEIKLTTSHSIKRIMT